MRAGITPCMCGHSVEEHGGDPKYPGATNCHAEECECLAYEADADVEADLDDYDAA